MLFLNHSQSKTIMKQVVIQNMSVNTQIQAFLNQLINDARSSIFLQLDTYQQHLATLTQSISQTISTIHIQYQHTLSIKGQQIAAFQNKINKMELEKQEQEFRYRQLQEQYARGKEDHEQLEQKMQQMRKQISDIRGYIDKRQQKQTPQQGSQTQQNDIFCDSYQGDNRFNELEVINEVTQYDMSVSASLQSLSSCLLEGQEKNTVTPNNSMSQLTDKQQESEQKVGNYQDALQFLKNYNSQPESLPSPTMSRNNKVSNVQILPCKQNIPLNQPIQHQGKPIKNGTIAKIKKMRHIDTLELQSGYVIKNAHIQTVSESQYKHSSWQNQQPSNISSACSTRLRSQQIISLQDPLSRLVTLINSMKVGQPTHIDVLRPSICSIAYRNQLTYKGNCDQKHLPSSYGKLYYKDEVVYQGEWREGKFHGWGKLLLLPFLNQQEKEVIQVDGNFRNGQLEGTCLCIFTSGERFMGCVKGGAIEGEGTFVGEKGILTGHWEDSCLMLLI